VPEPNSGPPKKYGPLSRTDFVRYAGASNDFNPMHHDDTVARATGEPSVFGHGMLSMGIAASYISAWFQHGHIRMIRARFRDRVWPGDELLVLGKVVGRRLDADEEIVELEISVHCGERIVVTNEAIVVLPAPGFAGH
jgi:acyl dehydratase